MAFTVVMVVTDRRVIFLHESDGPGSDRDTHSLEYADLAGVSLGTEGDSLEIRSTEGVTWQFPLPKSDPETVDAVVRHLDWIGEVRNRVLSTRSDVDLAAATMAGHAGAMEWQAADDTYEEARKSVDRLIDAVHRTKTVEDEHLAPGLTEIERNLEGAYAEVYIERAKSQLTLGEQLIENEDYDRARSVLSRAQDLYSMAKRHAEAVQRGDAFQFGQQRELNDELDRLAWEIEAVAAEPIRQAHEAKVLAKTAEDPEEGIDHWETAFRRYGSVLALEWNDQETNFAGNRAAVRDDMKDAASELIDLHRGLAREMWNTGVESQEDGSEKGALRLYKEAREHLARAHELAEEFDPQAARAIEQRLARLADSLARMRQTATVDSGASDRAAEQEAARKAESAGASLSRPIPEEGEPKRLEKRPGVSEAETIGGPSEATASAAMDAAGSGSVTDSDGGATADSDDHSPVDASEASE